MKVAPFCRLLAGLMLSIAFVARGGWIDYDWVSLVRPWGDGSLSLKCELDDHSPLAINFQYETSKKVARLLGHSAINDSVGAGWNETMVIRVEEGEVLTQSSFEDVLYFQHFNVPPNYSFSSDCDISVLGHKTVYLGVAVWDDMHWDCEVGWIALDVWPSQGSIELVASALVRGGGQITVGDMSGGSWPLDPEPPEPPFDPASLLEGGIRQTDIYVDASVESSGDGRSWNSPFRTIQEGVNAVRLDKTVVHVRPGIYEPVKVDNSRFTLNGLNHTFRVQSTDGPAATVIDGGPVYQASMDGFICTSTHCFSYGDDPVDLFDTLDGFTLRNASEGGRDGCYVNCIVSNCWFGIYRGKAVNCLLVNNYRMGMADGDMINCTVANNGWGTTMAKAYNSILWNNPAGNFAYGYAKGMAKSCCTTPWPAGEDGTITNDPQFVDAAHGDYRLRMGSPCINAGTPGFVDASFDLSGNCRVVRGAVDIGCYEYQPTNEHQTIAAPVPVEFAWIDEMCPKALAECGGDYDKVVLKKSANPVDISLPEPRRTCYSIWESYVADLDPNNSNQTFRATIEMVGGRPTVKGDPESPNRKYTIFGKEDLADEKWQEGLSGARFFKVKIELK